MGLEFTESRHVFFEKHLKSMTKLLKISHFRGTVMCHNTFQEKSMIRSEGIFNSYSPVISTSVDFFSGNSSIIAALIVRAKVSNTSQETGNN